jgi:hypothetical protein
MQVHATRSSNVAVSRRSVRISVSFRIPIPEALGCKPARIVPLEGVLDDTVNTEGSQLIPIPNAVQHAGTLPIHALLAKCSNPAGLLQTLVMFLD